MENFGGKAEPIRSVKNGIESIKNKDDSDVESIISNDEMNFGNFSTKGGKNKRPSRQSLEKDNLRRKFSVESEEEIDSIHSSRMMSKPPLTPIEQHHEQAEIMVKCDRYLKKDKKSSEESIYHSSNSNPPKVNLNRPIENTGQPLNMFNTAKAKFSTQKKEEVINNAKTPTATKSPNFKQDLKTRRHLSSAQSVM